MLDGINSYDMGELQRFHFKRRVSKRVIRSKNLDVMCTREKKNLPDWGRNEVVLLSMICRLCPIKMI